MENSPYKFQLRLFSLTFPRQVINKYTLVMGWPRFLLCVTFFLAAEALILAVSCVLIFYCCYICLTYLHIVWLLNNSRIACIVRRSLFCSYTIGTYLNTYSDDTIPTIRIQVQMTAICTTLDMLTSFDLLDCLVNKLVSITIHSYYH